MPIKKRIRKAPAGQGQQDKPLSAVGKAQLDKQHAVDSLAVAPKGMKVDRQSKAIAATTAALKAEKAAGLV